MLRLCYAYALVYRGSRLGFSRSNFAEKNKRLLAVYCNTDLHIKAHFAKMRGLTLGKEKPQQS